MPQEPPDARTDYYAILEIAPDATPEQIHQAYRRLVKLWHPDRYRLASARLHAQAERRMRLLTEAHSVLSDPVQRSAYDSEQAQVPEGQPMGTERWRVPAYEPGDYTGLTRPDRSGNGAVFFLGLVALLITLIGVININRVSGITGVIVGIVTVASGLFVLFAFTRPGAITEMITRPPAGMRRAVDPTEAPGQDRTGDDLSAFEQMVQDALDRLPADFAGHLGNLVVLVEQEPGMALLRRLHAAPGAVLLGLYEGVPLTKASSQGENILPERITLFQGPIERACAFDRDRIVAQVEATLLHEIAHHFGIDHDEMPIWLK